MTDSFFKRVLTLLLGAVAISCTPQVEVSPNAIPYVRQILSDQSGPEMAVLSASNSINSSDNIFLIGSAERCRALSERFLTSDEHDNVDGKFVPDMLPDFSGENISSIYDGYNSPYKKFLENGTEESLKEISVKNAIMALDTVCHVSPYDKVGLGYKKRAKIIVLTSPYNACYGYFDVDTLFRSAGCVVPVICPVSALIENVFDNHAGNLMVGVVARKDEVESGIYARLVDEIAAKKGREGAECVTFAVESPVYIETVTEEGDTLSVVDMHKFENALLQFMDNYIAAGYEKPLDALVIDDFTIDFKEMKETLSHITSVMSEESLTYNHLFAKDFELLDVTRSVMEECYRVLRENCSFSHKIKYPTWNAYLTVKNPESDEFMLIEYSDRFSDVQD